MQSPMVQRYHLCHLVVQQVQLIRDDDDGLGRQTSTQHTLLVPENTLYDVAGYVAVDGSKYVVKKVNIGVRVESSS